MVGICEFEITDEELKSNFIETKNGEILDSFSIKKNKRNIILRNSEEIPEKKLNQTHEFSEENKLNNLNKHYLINNDTKNISFAQLKLNFSLSHCSILFSMNQNK